MTNVMIVNWEKHGIDISKVRNGRTICPKCSHTRKNKKEQCLSVNIEEGIFNCHHCEFSGSAKEYKPKKEYNKPVPRLELLGNKTLEFFENQRKISNDTLLRMKISETKEWMPQFEQNVHCICFNYYRNGELVNIKFRGPYKSFKLVKDAELIFYNIDAIKDEKDSIIIVEGEIDCLSLIECGIYNVVSVPNGANKGKSKLEFVDNCWKYFEAVDKIILALDNDEAGKSIRNELARRLGKDKCYIVAFPDDCKDSNDVLVKHGKDALKKCIQNYTPLPLEGIKTMEEIFPVITEWYTNGYSKGAAARIPGFDSLLTFVPGQMTIVTGIPGHGKDEFTNLIMVNLAKYEDWSWGVCGFEETAAESTTKLIEKFTGKSFAFRINPSERITQEEFEYGVGMVDKYFKFINTEDVQTDIDGILDKAAEMVKKYGIKGFCLNPWNWIEHYRDPFVSETEYVSNTLTKIVSFAKRYAVHFFLIAHPYKMTKDKFGKYEIPTLYSISGSANFFNKTHNGITIYRDYKTNDVDVYVQKVKHSWLGRIGFCSFSFNTHTRQYHPLNINGASKSPEPVKKETPTLQLFNKDEIEQLPF